MDGVSIRILSRSHTPTVLLHLQLTGMRQDVSLSFLHLGKEVTHFQVVGEAVEESRGVLNRSVSVCGLGCRGVWLTGGFGCGGGGVFAGAGEFSSSLTSHSLDCQMVQRGTFLRVGTGGGGGAGRLRLMGFRKSFQELERGVNWRKA